MVLTLSLRKKIRTYDHSDEYYRWILYGGTINYAVKVVLTFRLVDELLKFELSDQNYWAVLSCCTLYYTVQGGSNFWLLHEILDLSNFLGFKSRRRNSQGYLFGGGGRWGVKWPSGWCPTFLGLVETLTAAVSPSWPSWNTSTTHTLLVGLKLRSRIKNSTHGAWRYASHESLNSIYCAKQKKNYVNCAWHNLDESN